MKLVKMLTPPVKASIISFAFLAALSARANSSFDWTGEDGVVTVPDGETAIVSNCDLTAIANLTKITCAGTTSRILFRNTEPFTLNAEIAGPGGSENGQAVIEMTANTGKITFAKKVYFNEGRRIILGNADILGQFGADRGGGGKSIYGSITALDGCTVDFKEGSKLQREYINYLYGAGTFKFACKIPTTSAAAWIICNASGKMVMNGDNLLNAGYVNAGDVSYVIDMNGHPQGIPYLLGTYRITSETPATFTYMASSTTDSTSGPAFLGQAAFEHASPKKTTFSSGASTTAGGLSVTAGNLVIGGTASWKGGAVSVTGGKLTLNTAIAMGSNVDVSVSGSGVLEIPAGVTCAANSLTINGVVIDLTEPASLADLAETYPDNVSGEGFIGRPITRYVSLAGDDGADGKTEETAWKTFSFSCARAYPAGSRLVVLPGVYNEEVMTKSGLSGGCRLVIPDGLTVVSRDGAETTIIEGQSATSPVWNGCGTDSLRCVYVGNGSRLEGFTLRGGRARSTGTNEGDGGGVYAFGKNYSPGDSWIVDCVITNCAAGNTGGASFFGKFLRCRFFDCNTQHGYASGIRCGAAYNCYFKGMRNTGALDAASGAPEGIECVGNTFVHGKEIAIRSFSGKVTDCVFVGTVAPNNSTTKFRNCLFTTAPNSDATTNGACRVVTEAELALDAFGRPARTSVAVNAGVLADYEAAMPTGEADLDGSGLSRYLFGGLDVGAYEYDPRADFSATLGDGVTVRAVTDDVVYGAEDKTVVIPSDEEMSLDWTLGRNPNTEFSFDVALADGAALEVYDHETLLETVTEPKMVSFTSDEAADLRLVATGEGAAEVSNFRHDTTAMIAVEKGGVELTGAVIGVNYVTDGPLTFAMKRKLDSSDALSTGFASNGVFYAWADYPDGWTYTVSDRASSINVAAVYADPLDTWYVAQDGGDDNAHYGRLPEDAFATIQKALKLAKKGDTVIVLPGTYEGDVMGSAGNWSRVVIPEGVTLKSREGAAATMILGKKATSPISGYEQCGTDSARCVTMLDGAHLVGFTLTGGYATTDGTTHKSSSAINAAGANDYIVDCVITNCYSPNVYTCCNGKYLRCIVQNCRTKQQYACGVREAYAYDCAFRNFTNNGYMDTAKAVVNCTFDCGTFSALRGTTTSSCPHVYNSIFISTVAEPALTYHNCVFTKAQAAGSTLDNCLVTNSTAIALNSTKWTIGADSVARGFADRTAYREKLLAAGFTAEEIGRGTDVHGAPRVQGGALDAGASQYDRRPEFSAILAPDGTLGVTWVDPEVVPSGNGLGLPDGQTLELDWSMPPVDETTFQFSAELADGASLAVFANGAQLATQTESGTVTFKGTSAVALRLVATGAVTVHDFRNAAKAAIEAPKGGVTVEGAQIGDNFVGSKPLTFTVRRAFDAYEQYSTGFNSNGVFYAWADFPDGFTYTVSDIDSAIAVTVVYDESPTEWYVDPVKGDDTENYGRHPENPMKTLKAAARRATSGQTIHAAAGTYAEGVMGSTSGTAGFCRVVVPEGVALVADEGAEKTFIVGAKASPEDAWLALSGCGTNAVRGAYLGKNATLRGFTLTGGYGYCYINNKSELTGEYGGAIQSANASLTKDNVARIYDCIISNNYAWGAGGAHCGVFTRCKFVGNRSKLGYRVGFTGTPGYAINCYFEDNYSPVETTQGHITDISAAINCTLAGTRDGVRAAGAATCCYNCIFQGRVSQTIAENLKDAVRFRNCRATAKPSQQTATTWDPEALSNEIVSLKQLALDPVTHAPASRDLEKIVDSGVAWNIYTNQVASILPENEYMKDLNGGQRVYNGALDIGAAEYDWRETYRGDLGSRKWLAVEAASEGVIETEEKTVRLGNGDVVALTFTIEKVGGEDFVTVPFVLSGEGTLTATLDGEPLEPRDGAFTVKATAAERTLVLTYSGEGYADLTKMRRNAGVLLLVR